MIKMLTKVFLIGVIYGVILIVFCFLISLLESLFWAIILGLVMIYLIILSIGLLINNNRIYNWLIGGEENDI